MIQDKLKQQKQAASKKVNPAKLLIANEPKRAAKATAKSKAKAKAGASSKTVIELADDAGRTDNEVAVHGVGGTAFTREKYFIDCLVMCVRSVEPPEQVWNQWLQCIRFACLHNGRKLTIRVRPVDSRQNLCTGLDSIAVVLLHTRA